MQPAHGEAHRARGYSQATVKPTEPVDAARWHDKVFHTDVHENDVLTLNMG